MGTSCHLVENRLRRQQPDPHTLSVAKETIRKKYHHKMKVGGWAGSYILVKATIRILHKKAIRDGGSTATHSKV